MPTRSSARKAAAAAEEASAAADADAAEAAEADAGTPGEQAPTALIDDPPGADAGNAFEDEARARDPTPGPVERGDEEVIADDDERSPPPDPAANDSVPMGEAAEDLSRDATVAPARDDDPSAPGEPSGINESGADPVVEGATPAPRVGGAMDAALDVREKEKDAASDGVNDATDPERTPVDAEGSFRRPVEMKKISSAKLDRARAKLKVNLHDLDAWEVIANDAQTRGVPDCRSLFEEVLAVHPTSSRVWRAYAEAEVAGSPDGTRDDEAVKALFSRCLLVCLSGELWRSYTRYMHKCNDEESEEGVQAIKAAYEYTVDHVGEDVNSGPLWLDYVSFLKKADPAHVCPAAKPEQAESARMQEVRRAYQRAVSVPTHSIDALYREYDAFEHGVSPTLAKALLSEVKPKVDHIRVVLKERKKKTDPLVVGGLAGPPEPSKDDKSPEGQARLWRAYIAWEKTNPQRLQANAEAGETIHPQLTARVALAYEQALMSLVHFPDMWLELATWHENEGRVDDAVAALARARESIPGCMLLHFAAADAEETRGNIAGARAVYEDLMSEHEKTATAAATVAGNAASVHPPMDNNTLLVYVEYMRCVRRMEGQQMARKAFMRARKAPGVRWEIFAAAALLEWRYDKSDKPARNIFELGLKAFINVPAFVAQYAEFLVGCNDVANARVLFERAVSALPTSTTASGVAPPVTAKEKEKRLAAAKEVWDLFVTFEQTHGTMETISAVERRRHVALDNPGGGVESAAAIITALMGRHSFLSLRAATPQQVTHFTRLGASIAKVTTDAAAGVGATATAGVSRYAAARAAAAAASSATAAAVAAAARAAKTSVDATRRQPAPPAKVKAPDIAPPPPAPPTGEPKPQLKPAALKPAAKVAPGTGLPKAPGVAPLPPPPPGSSATHAQYSHLPSELASFITRLPAPSAVSGVSAQLVDAVMDTLLTSDMSPSGGAAVVNARNTSLGIGGGGDTGTGDGEEGEGGVGGRGTKRKNGDGGGARGGGRSTGPMTAATHAPPTGDVFRMRQAKQQRTDQAEFR